MSLHYICTHIILFSRLFVTFFFRFFVFKLTMSSGAFCLSCLIVMLTVDVVPELLLGIGPGLENIGRNLWCFFTHTHTLFWSLSYSNKL